jgi:hypothetical protein
LDDLQAWLSNSVAAFPDLAPIVVAAITVLTAVAIAGVFARVKYGPKGLFAVLVGALLLTGFVYILVSDPVPSYFPPDTGTLRVINFAISTTIALTLVLLPMGLFGDRARPFSVFLLGLPGVVVSGLLAPILPAVVACYVLMMECL